jgi:membrane dipeptidase
MRIQIVSILLLSLLLSNCGTSEEQLARRADRIHRSVLTVDTHCDTPMSFDDPGFDMGVRHEEGCVDFPRMIEGGLDAEFFAVFTGQGPRNDSAYTRVHNKAIEILDAIHKNVKKNSSLAEIAYTADDAYRLKKSGKLAAFIGIENGYPIGLDLSRIKQYHDRGARYITLCHSRNNDICDSSNDPGGPEHNGLSQFGIQVVKEMNKIGMMVDVSHLSDKSFYDVLSVTRAPVIASHSSSRALCCNPRNLSDDMLLALKGNGGVIQICILSAYLKTIEPNPEMGSRLKELQIRFGTYDTISSEDRKSQMRKEYREIRKRYEKLAEVTDVVDHIDHVVQVAGINHVGIGTDFDGGGGVEGCMNVSEMKNITIELLRRGYSKKEVEKIWSGNIMRVLRQAEETAGKS